MSDGLNPSQREIAETLDGMVVVDAGPGTGKTHTIVQRYVNLVSREDVSPSDILMLTFTKNAASEMEDRIRSRLTEKGMREESKFIHVKTFDAFCLSVVMESPEETGSLFGIEEKLTHAAAMVENETLNRAYFNSFLDNFLDSRGEDYGRWAVIASQMPKEFYSIVNRLMARGIFPIRGSGWFGGDNGRELTGDTQQVLHDLRMLNDDLNTRGVSKLARSFMDGFDQNEYDMFPEDRDAPAYDDRTLSESVDEDRSDLHRFIHDIYWHYIRRCISDDRLTFGVTAMLAFSVLYSNSGVRAMNSFRYIIIDEFQDTNASQLMMTLMILKEPNLCVVGDWKQGIYGFRFVSVENILDFRNRAETLRRQLNDDQKRVQFSIPDVKKLALRENYRSSQLIIDTSFECMKLKGKTDDPIDPDEVERNLARLNAKHQDVLGRNTGIWYVRCDGKESEAETVAKVVRDYIGSGDYRIVDTGTGEERPVGFGDIAVLCRKTSSCRMVLETLNGQGIPAFMQGDVEVMSTREGKLALAWLRYLNNEQDPWGFVPIMVDMGYSMVECRKAQDSKRVPRQIHAQRKELYAKRRRVTELLSSIFGWYGLDNDITQTIITILSSAHRNSLLTISDLISMIEEDISSKTSYPVDMDLGSDAVRIMTMHKSKGLEFPIVIIPYLDAHTMPSTQGDRDAITFDPVRGIRCGRTIGEYGDYSKIAKSWRTRMVRATRVRDYDEERRLMFVAVSRAKQYVTMISGDPSPFMKGLSGEGYCTIRDVELDGCDHARELIQRPDVSGYEKRRPVMGVHSVMRLEFEDGLGGMSDADEIGGKGKEYGTAVHLEAQYLERGLAPSGRYPDESEYILGNVLSRKGMDGFLKSFSEVECRLPVESAGFALRGTIDLLLLFDDRVEIHDYKTDLTDRFQREYELQLSIYAETARQYYRGLPVRCFIDYVSQGRTVEFDPLTMERIEGIVIPRARENLLDE